LVSPSAIAGARCAERRPVTGPVKAALEISPIKTPRTVWARRPRVLRAGSLSRWSRGIARRVWPLPTQTHGLRFAWIGESGRRISPWPATADF